MLADLEHFVRCVVDSDNKTYIVIYGIPLGPSRLDFLTQRATMRQYDNAMTTVRQCDDDSAIVR
jgi:hypothetical protein